ncbi:helix-turn-helix domain-containing protein [Amycolatopsis sp. FBCC-B4732]|uniref:PucR family transcriptional regulator n=1 Tax=unclassified Amycolatopsis TaxID=2618356 RepID=UPI001FF5AC7A|nr:helix-turn-helix domain-containing protein [Amycolatopsis sp. FBCC-B4732]UOX91888.1 helix-turn-helix domain-containing protein [Amycolatopsis sp. FBCC-B4732]
MKGLLLRLSGLDADAENAVRVIGFFDRLITARADLDTLVRTTADLAGCPVGVHAPGRGLSLRAAPGGEVSAPGTAPTGSAVRSLEGGVAVWVARAGAPLPLDDMLLERFAIATAILLEHSGVPTPELGDPALVELALTEDAGTAERSRALHLLGFGPSARLRVLATVGGEVPAGRSALLGNVRAVLVADAPRSPAGSGAQATATPAGHRVGVGPVVPAIEVARSWAAARTALKFTSDGDPVVSWERLGSLAAFEGALSPAGLAELADVRALDRLAAETHGEDTLAALEALCATGSARKAAAVLHRHHSTMPARLARAEAVLGFDVDSPAGRFRLHLALMLRRLRDNAELSRPS